MIIYRFIAGYVAGFLLGCLLLFMFGCSVYRSSECTVIDWGTGNRGFTAAANGQVSYWHGDIPATIDSLVPLTEAIAEGAAKGAVKGATGAGKP